VVALDLTKFKNRDVALLVTFSSDAVANVTVQVANDLTWKVTNTS